MLTLDVVEQKTTIVTVNVRPRATPRALEEHKHKTLNEWTWFPFVSNCNRNLRDGPAWHHRKWKTKNGKNVQSLWLWHCHIYQWQIQGPWQRFPQRYLILNAQAPMNLPVVTKLQTIPAQDAATHCHWNDANGTLLVLKFNFLLAIKMIKCSRAILQGQFLCADNVNHCLMARARAMEGRLESTILEKRTRTEFDPLPKSRKWSVDDP